MCEVIIRHGKLDIGNDLQLLNDIRTAVAVLVNQSHVPSCCEFILDASDGANDCAMRLGFDIIVLHPRKIRASSLVFVSGVEVTVVELHELLMTLIEIDNFVTNLWLEVPSLSISCIGRFLKKMCLSDLLPFLIDFSVCRADTDHTGKLMVNLE